MSLGPLTMPILGYLGIVNVGAAGLFYYDKQQALSKGWRVPERQLQLTALLGGWVGGMWAMKTFKHKTVKQEFRIPYFAATGLNILGMGLIGGGMLYSPAFRSRMQSQLKNFKL